jgi:hypothetical protein
MFLLALCFLGLRPYDLACLHREEIRFLEDKVIVRVRIGKNAGENGKVLHLPYDVIGQPPASLIAFCASGEHPPFWIAYSIFRTRWKEIVAKKNLSPKTQPYVLQHS